MKPRYLIAAHPIQRAVLERVSGKGIDELSLRNIGATVSHANNGVPVSAQQVKHHLTQMVRYGFLDIVRGKYRIGSLLRRSR